MNAIQKMTSLNTMKLQEQSSMRLTPCVREDITYNVARIEDVVADSNPTTICQVVLKGGQEDAAIMIKLALCDYLESLSLRSPMTEAQIDKVVHLIMKKHPHLPMTAIPLFFENAQCQQYGDHFGRMDVPTLMGWVQQFENEYFNMCDEQSYAEHQSTKGDKANYAEIIHANAQDKPVPMPESLERKLHIKSKEDDIIEEVRLRIIKENAHLFSTMEVEKAQEHITNLINDELIKQGIFKLD